MTQLPDFQPPEAVGQSDLERIMRNYEKRIKATESDTGWIAPTLAGAWANHTPGTWAVAGYRRKNGIVYLKGLVKSGTGTIFTLPNGFRPVEATHMAVPSNGGTVGMAIINISTTGVV